MYVFYICFHQENISSPKTYFSEFDLLLVNHLGRGGAASAVHKPPSVSNQNHIRLLHNLRLTACQCVPHLVLQGSSIGVNLKEGLYSFECLCLHEKLQLIKWKMFLLYSVAQELARQTPEGVEVEKTAG